MSGIEGSCGLRKILSLHLSKVVNQIKSIKSFVSPYNNPRTNAQQSLTSVAYTIDEEKTFWEKKEDKKGINVSLWCETAQEHV